MRKRSKKTAKLYRAERVPLVKRLLSEVFNCERCGGRSEVVHDHPRQATEEGWLSNRWTALRSP
jgi:C4-type Zn-finger protein